MRTSAGWSVAVLVGAMVATLEAQQGQGANIGSNDATAVLRRGPLSRVPGEPVEILSAMPESFPRELLPAGAEFAAAAASPSLTTVVVSLPVRERFDFYKYQWRLEELGWMNTGSVRFGFNAGGPGGGGLPFSLCKSGEFAQISVLTQPGGVRFLRLGLGPEPRRSCAPIGSRMFSDIALPMLELPPSVRTTGNGSSGGTDEIQAGARLETALSAESLAANFIGQLKEAGWRIESGPMGDGVMVIARLSSSSRAGDAVTAILGITSLTGTPFVDASIRVIRNKPSR
jgi:hypothetical protein